MMKVDLEGNLLKRTTALENAISQKVSVNADNLTATGKANIINNLLPNYAAGSDVSSSVFAASGVGFTASKRGVCLIRALNSSGTSIIYLYSGGVLRLQKNFNTDGYGSSDTALSLAMGTGDSVRINPVAGTVGTDSWAVFYPYKGN